MPHPEEHTSYNLLKTALIEYGPPLLVWLAIVGVGIGGVQWMIGTQVTALLQPTTTRTVINETNIIAIHEDIKDIKTDLSTIRDDMADVKETVARIEGYLQKR